MDTGRESCTLLPHVVYLERENKMEGEGSGKKTKQKGVYSNLKTFISDWLICLSGEGQVSRKSGALPTWSLGGWGRVMEKRSHPTYTFLCCLMFYRGKEHSVSDYKRQYN